MTKVQIIKQVLKAYPEFTNLGPYFYLPDYDYILSGFLYNRTPSGFDCIQFVYPLFDKECSLHLTYSRDLFYKSFESIDKKDIAIELIQGVKPHVSKFKDCLTLDAFFNHMMTTKSNRVLSHESCQKTLGYLSILLDEKDEAIKYLQLAIAQQRSEDSPINIECKPILKLLEQNNMALAQQKVIGFADEMRTKIEAGDKTLV